MHTWVEWKKGHDGQIMRRYFDNPKDAQPFAKRMQKKDISLKLKLIERNNMLPLAGMYSM